MLNKVQVFGFYILSVLFECPHYLCILHAYITADFKCRFDFMPYGACLLWCRDLDQASMEAVVSLLAGLPLQPEEGDGVELMEAKSQLFLK